MSRRVAVGVALALGALGVASGIARTAPALEAHARLRDAWRLEREQAGGPRYDPARSDRLYAASRVAHERAGQGARWLALGLLAFVASRRAPTLRESVADGPAPATRPRLALASLVDLLLATLGLAALGLDVAESAALYALARAAPLLGPGLVLVGLATGRSPGLRLVGLVVAPSPLRALVATLALPLAALAPLLWLAGRTPAPHLHLAGLAPSAGPRARG